MRKINQTKKYNLNFTELNLVESEIKTFNLLRIIMNKKSNPKSETFKPGSPIKMISLSIN
jgi:hypothetical protein